MQSRYSGVVRLLPVLTVITMMTVGCGNKPGGQEDPRDANTQQDAGPDASNPADAATTPLHPDKTVTSGGARRSSPNYRMDLYIAPVRPVGSTSSPNFRLKLGPASVRVP